MCVSRSAMSTTLLCYLWLCFTFLVWWRERALVCMYVRVCARIGTPIHRHMHSPCMRAECVGNRGSTKALFLFMICVPVWGRSCALEIYTYTLSHQYTCKRCMRSMKCRYIRWIRWMPSIRAENWIWRFCVHYGVPIESIFSRFYQFACFCQCFDSPHFG